MNETILILAAGAIGGLLKSMIENKGRVFLPKLEITESGTYIHFGFIMNMVVGAVAAFGIAATVPAALTAGLSSAFLSESIMEKTPLGK